jgi:hypothetical protein
MFARGCYRVVKASRKKKLLVQYLKSIGFRWSKKLGVYVDGKEGVDYMIEEVEEVKDET